MGKANLDREARAFLSFKRYKNSNTHPQRNMGKDTMKLGLGIGFTKDTVQPLLYATVQNRGFHGQDSDGSRKGYVFRIPHVAGTNLKTIQLLSKNWYITDSAETNNGNTFTYEDVSIQIGSTVVPVYWGGSRSKTLADGDNNILSNQISAGSFGLSYIPQNTTIWIKGRMSVTTNGNKIPYGAYFIGDLAGSQAAWYDTVGVTASSTDATGVYTFTGGVESNRIVGHSPLVVGRAIAPTKVYFGVGDSILYGYADMDQDAYGRGFFQRAMHDGSFNAMYPSMNFSLSGIGTAPFVGANPKWTALAAYANRGVETLLTNNVDNQDETTMQTNVQTIWSRMKGAGIQKIIRPTLLARTTSTDSWATVANQTVLNSNWDTGGRVPNMNAWFLTQVGTTIDAVCSMASVLDTDTRYWKTNNVANRMTNDGVHPYDNGGNGIGNQTLATALRATMASLN